MHIIYHGKISTCSVNISFYHQQRVFLSILSHTIHRMNKRLGDLLPFAYLYIGLTGGSCILNINMQIGTYTMHYKNQNGAFNPSEYHGFIFSYPL